MGAFPSKVTVPVTVEAAPAGSRLPVAVPLGDDALDHRPADEPTHGVGDQVDARRPGLREHQLDEPQQVLRRRLQPVRLPPLTERRRGGVVEAVDPDGRPGHLAVALALQVRLLPALDLQDVVVLGEQAQQRALELCT